MKRLFKKFLPMLLAFSMVLGLNDDITVAAGKLRLNKTKATVMAGKSITLKLKGTHGKASWKSSNKKVAVVNGAGKVKAKRKGNTVITCSANGQTYQCRLKVTRDTTIAPVYSYDGEDDEDEPEVTATPEPTASPEPLTEEEVYRRLIALQAKYPEGMEWGMEKEYRCKTTGTVIAYACAAFALTITNEAFGYTDSKLVNFDSQNVKVGDQLIMLDRHHEVVVLEVHPSYVVVVEGNYDGKVHWGRVIQFSSLDPSQTYIETNYLQ